MVKIRLTRTGKKHQPHYRIVAVHDRSKRDGAYLDLLGYYNPRTKPPTVKYSKELVLKWLKNGAQMTDTVHDIFVREKLIKQTPARTKRIELLKLSSKQRLAETTPPQDKPESKEEAEPSSKEATEEPVSENQKVETAEPEESKPEEKNQESNPEPSPKEQKPDAQPEDEDEKTPAEETKNQ